MDAHITFYRKKHNKKQFPAANDDNGQFKVNFINIVKCTPDGIWKVPLMVYQNHHYKLYFLLCVKLRMKWPVHYFLSWYGVCWYTDFYRVIFHQFRIIQRKLLFLMSFFSCNLCLRSHIFKVVCCNVKIVGFLNVLIYNETFKVEKHFQLYIRPPERAILCWYTTRGT